MKTKAYTYPSASALATIHAWQWYPEDGNVKAVLLLHHGMAEHCGRYGDFLLYVLGRRPRRRAELSADQSGTLMHWVLQMALDPLPDADNPCAGLAPFLELDDDAMAGLAGLLVDEFAKRYLPEDTARFAYLLSRLKKSMTSLLCYLRDEQKQSCVHPAACELRIGSGEDAVPGQVYHLSDGRTVQLVGTVDRADEWVEEDGTRWVRVVDYKTGSKKLDLKVVYCGLDCQMLLYLFTLQREGSSYFGRPVEPAGVLYMPARDIILQADRALPPDKIEDMLRRELRRTGMLLGEPEVLTAMEHSALESPCYLPVGVTKDGAMQGLASSVLVSTAQMGKMARYIDSLLHRVAREIGEGNIAAAPCTRGPQDSACAWCAFQSACWFDESRDKPHYLRKTTPEEFWQVVDEEVKQRG